MPPTIDNPTDRAREESDDADWARWEQTFRDARPILPEAAMARIEASIRREAERSATPKKSRLRLWILLLVGFLIAVNGIVLVILVHDGDQQEITPKPGGGATVHLMEDRFPMDVIVGRPLIAPDRPILQFAGNMQMGWHMPYENDMAPIVVPGGDLLLAAEKAGPNALDGWHQLGLMEMRRVAGISAPLPASFPPHDDDFYVVSLWRMLPLEDKDEPAFRQGLDRLNGVSFQTYEHHLSPDGVYWTEMYKLFLTQHDKKLPEWSTQLTHNGPAQFPSRLGDRARFELLSEMGETKAQAALDVLSTRSYQPLAALLAYQKWDKLQYPLVDYLPMAHDAVDRVFALRLMKQEAEAYELVANAAKIRYLNDPQDMAVLLARLGPEDAWTRLLQPLMEDEAGFIQNPPNFDQTGAHSLSTAVVTASTETVKDGNTTYLGPILKLSAGPWRITCDRLISFRNADHGMLLTGSGEVRVEGVLGMFNATADDMTLNTQTGELKLSGHVHLEGWSKTTDINSCTITRTGEVKPAE